MSVSGNPALVSEAVLALRGCGPIRPKVDGPCCARSTTLSKQRGYVTSVTAEPI